MQTSAGHPTQEGEAMSEAERNEDFSDLQHEEGCDDEVAEHAPGAARAKRTEVLARRPPRRRL